MKQSNIYIKKIKYFGRHSNKQLHCIAANLIYTHLKLHNNYHYVYGLGFAIRQCIKGDYITLSLAMLPMNAITCNTY